MAAPILPRVSLYDEIVVYSAPRAGSDEPSSAPTSGPRISRFDNWFYTRVLPLRLAAARAPSGGAAPALDIGDLPLVGHCETTFQRRSYAELMKAFYRGEAALVPLGKSLDSSYFPDFMRFYEKPLPEGVQLRFWWFNTAQEVEDIAWESIALPNNRSSRVWMVRGAPGPTLPPLPFFHDRQMTIAVFDPADLAPESLLQAFEDIRSRVMIVRLEAKDPHQALCEAARAGVEGVHVIADGSVPLDTEGLLDFPGGAMLSSRDAHEMLHSSRAAILALSEPASPHLDAQGLPTVYRGFARFGRAIGDGLSVVAPLGPIAPLELRRFWREFYLRFAEVLDVEDALVSATPHPLTVPMVLFLRHRFGRQFTRSAGSGVNLAPGAGGWADPAQVNADLSLSSGLLEAAQSLQRRYAELGLKFPGNDLIHEERARERALASYLEGLLAQEKSR
jgi:hypothetical protein